MASGFPLSGLDETKLCRGDLDAGMGARAFFSVCRIYGRSRGTVLGYYCGGNTSSGNLTGRRFSVLGET